MAFMQTHVSGGVGGGQGHEKKDIFIEEMLPSFSCRPLLKYVYSVSEGGKMETLVSYGGFLETWRQGRLGDGHALLGEIKFQELDQAGKEIVINGEASCGYILKQRSAFVRGIEGREFTVGAKLWVRHLLHLQDIETAHGRVSLGSNQSSLSRKGRKVLLKEESFLPITNKKLQLSVLEEDDNVLVTESNCCKVTFQFGDNGSILQVLKNYDSGTSRFLNIERDCQLLMHCKIIFNCTNDGKLIEAKPNGLSNLDSRCLHLDLWLKELGEKCNGYFNGVPSDSSPPDSTHISENRVLTDLGKYCSGSATELEGEHDLRLLRTAKVETKVKHVIKLEDDYQVYLGSRDSPAQEPHEGLLYILPFLQLRELLALEQVLRSLRNIIQNDVLLWQSLVIEHPLNKKVTDEVLLRLSVRAQGHLHCLSLLECCQITAYAVQQILASNPMLLKLFLPGCTKISADAVVAMVKEYTERKDLNAFPLKQLRIRGLYGITKEHVEQLSSLIFKMDHGPSKPKLRYYRYGHYYDQDEDDRPIDVEVCPKCTNVRVVYDCTRDKCQSNETLKLPQCRGCTFCIARCEECGTCIEDTEYEETFCLDLLCSACWLRLPQCAECNRPGCGKHVDHFIGNPDTVFLMC